MEYIEHNPASWLVPFIDCYWTLRAENTPKEHIRRIIPDICADIILNIGDDVQVFNGQSHQLKSEKAYLVGTMTTFQDTVVKPDSHLIGIRFKPFGLRALLGFSLQGTANKIEELDRHIFSLDDAYDRTSSHTPHPFSIDKLNTYFFSRINGQNNNDVNHIIDTILKRQGQISISQLAQLHHITERQLERKFEASVGITIKEVCNLTRFQHAYQLIKSRGERSLLDIAFEAGYYDHAHLTKHIKRYAGSLPSQL